MNPARRQGRQRTRGFRERRFPFEMGFVVLAAFAALSLLYLLMFVRLRYDRSLVPILPAVWIVRLTWRERTEAAVRPGPV